MAQLNKDRGPIAQFHQSIIERKRQMRFMSIAWHACYDDDQMSHYQTPETYIGDNWRCSISLVASAFEQAQQLGRGELKPEQLTGNARILLTIRS